MLGFSDFLWYRFGNRLGSEGITYYFDVKNANILNGTVILVSSHLLDMVYNV